MNNNKKTQYWSGTIARLLLGITFTFSGIVKAIDPLGTTYKIEDYLKAFGGFFTDLLPMAEPAAFILITVEFVLGICLLLNIRTNVTSWVSLLFYIVMTPLTLYLAITNPVSDCGCFGDAIVLTNWQTFSKNVVLSILTIILLCCRKSLRQTWVWQAELVISIISAGIVVALILWTLSHLPLIDFRPYKTGNHLPTLMEMPEDAESDVYEVTLIYEKDGVRKEFNIDNYPKGDSTWHFVDQKSTLVRKGYEPPIHDFEILTMEYEDITYDILESGTPVTLIIMYDLAKTDRNSINNIKAEINSCVNRGEACYIVTGSGEEDIYNFVEETGIEEEMAETLFCTCDPVTLKTIVRANPGVVVIKEGTVIEKRNIQS